MDSHIPELKIEHLDAEGPDALILLEQDSGGNIDRVAIHPLHLRHMAEQLGLIAAIDPQAHRTIATLKRRLFVLRERIDHLAQFLALHSDHEHADLSYEQTYARATAEIADEFCEELLDLKQAEPVQAKPEPTAPVQASLL